MMHLSVYSIYTMRRCEWTHRDIHRGLITRMKCPIWSNRRLKGLSNLGTALFTWASIAVPQPATLSEELKGVKRSPNQPAAMAHPTIRGFF